MSQSAADLQKKLIPTILQTLAQSPSRSEKLEQLKVIVGVILGRLNSQCEGEELAMKIKDSLECAETMGLVNIIRGTVFLTVNVNAPDDTSSMDDVAANSRKKHSKRNSSQTHSSDRRGRSVSKKHNRSRRSGSP